MPTALVSAAEVTAGRGRVLGHGPVAGNIDGRLLEVLVESRVCVTVAGGVSGGMEHDAEKREEMLVDSHLKMKFLVTLCN